MIREARAHQHAKVPNVNTVGPTSTQDDLWGMVKRRLDGVGASEVQGHLLFLLDRSLLLLGVLAMTSVAQNNYVINRLVGLFDLSRPEIFSYTLGEFFDHR